MDDVVGAERNLDEGFFKGVERVRASAARRAVHEDTDGSFPAKDIRDLDRAGLLAAPFPAFVGGLGLGIGDPERLCRVLTALGQGSLALGRLYEGHVNAVALVSRYGTPANLKLLKDDADAGRPSGVWMAGDALEIKIAAGRHVLSGKKILCSGAGHFRRPLVAAKDETGSVMIIPCLDRPERSDASNWTAQGMRATATGTVDFEGLVVKPEEIVGSRGDYLRSPYFRGGAWRVLAVQLGGLEAIMEAYKEQLATSAYSDHPIQLARLGEAEIACETARLWVRRASIIAESPFDNAEEVDAYVDLARNAFERVALQLVSLVQKAIGLKAFLRPNPLERICRDLLTYLRQPALDASLLSAASFRLQNRQ